MKQVISIIINNCNNKLNDNKISILVSVFYIIQKCIKKISDKNNKIYDINRVSLYYK